MNTPFNDSGRAGDDSILPGFDGSRGGNPLLQNLTEDLDSSGAPSDEFSADASDSFPGSPIASLTGVSVLLEGLLRRPSVSEAVEQSQVVSSCGKDFSISFSRSPSASCGAGSAGNAGQLAFPETNDEIFGFRLLRVLGQGAFARVFLARQGVLAHREVVLKISAIEGTEPQTLAQLQHTHVVPIYSVHEDVNLKLRAVCMPFFGGACLATVLTSVWNSGPAPESGRHFVTALEEVAGPRPDAKVARHPSAGAAQPVACDDLASRSFVAAAAWIVQRLAEGLQHAHERGVLHRDIKPSNILISADGQPLLLDFNVSQAADCDQDHAALGGTISYMAPEQLLAIVSRDRADAIRVDERADIYSLGLVLYEMLVGKNPFQAAVAGQQVPWDKLIDQRRLPVSSLRENSPLAVPWSLESIARKCLAPDSDRRYRSAAELALDLSCFLQDLPLRVAPELSRVEQAQKWRRRHPRTTLAAAAIVLSAALFIPGSLLLHFARHDLATAQDQLLTRESTERARQFHGAAQQALSLANTVVPNDQTLTSGIAACERTLGLYGVLDTPDWQKSVFLNRLESKARTRVLEDIRELLLVLAAVRSRVSSHDTAAAESGLLLLEQAEQIRELPPSRALLLDRVGYLAALERTSEAQQVLADSENVKITGAHDLYMLAGAHARQRTAQAFREAIALLDRAIDISPNHYWSYFERALCHQELGEPFLAAGDLGTCIGLSPDSSWAYFNRGYIFAQQGSKPEAISDYTRAIKYSSEFSSAYFNRGLAYLETRQYELALADFERVRSLGRDDAVLDAGCAMALEGVGRHEDADRLFTLATDRGGEALDASTLRIRWTYGFAVAHRAPQLARQAFDDVLSANPNHPQALYGRGMLAMQTAALPQAVKFFDRALRVAPEFVEPRRYRAITLARLGELENAAEDANLCLEKGPTASENLYTAACVAALSARKLRSAELRAQAIEILKQAIKCGTSRRKLLDDPDLSALRDDAEFQKLAREID